MSSKKIAAKKSASPSHPMIGPTPRNFRLGNDLYPTRDLRRFVKFPPYIVLQRQRAILMKRLKTPPALNLVTSPKLCLPKNEAASLLTFLSKYAIPSTEEKKERLMEIAAIKAKGEVPPASKKPVHIKFGLNHVVSLVESKMASLVVIPHDVSPPELVIFLPALCRKMGVPFVMVKGKARLAKVVGGGKGGKGLLKTATCVALAKVKKEDEEELKRWQDLARKQFNDNYDLLGKRQWGAQELGFKSRMKLAKREKLIQEEEMKKNMAMVA